MSVNLEQSKKSEGRKEDILRISYELFLNLGYTKTSMREIASKSEVSLGLASYYFKSKRAIAKEIIGEKFAQFEKITGDYVNKQEHPILYSALLVCLNYTIFSSEKFILFYQDTMREDIFLEMIIASGNETYLNIRNKYQPELSDEEANAMGWYGNHISVSMERTLVLYAGKSPLLEETIPEIIFKSYIGLWHFDGIEQETEKACEESKILTVQIIAEHPELFN